MIEAGAAAAALGAAGVRAQQPIADKLKLTKMRG
jgi:hypothetical protein